MRLFYAKTFSLMWNLDALTIVSCLVIITFAVSFWIYTKTASPEKLRRKERTIDAMPSIISTLGVLGTFLGITVGLMGFDVNDLTTSVPELLDGLKTAFFTSLCGMVGSLILRHLVTDRKYEENSLGTSDAQLAHIAICHAVAEMQNAVVAAMQATKPEISDMKEAVKGICTATESTLEETRKFSQVLRGEVNGIEQKMTETNALLTKKFDEFSELLKKSNTEALVEVMKRVTEEFQSQMNALISRLIQENFEKLNQSVEKLNEWQQENKAMIDALTKQYKAMAQDFDGTSTVLAEVSADTKALTGEGSKLQRLINELQKVMIDDKKFTEITAKLESTVSLTKSNMTAFDETTHKLNEWISKQRDFNSGVQMLIAKLDELNKIRDYGEQFWHDTKQGMDESVGILKNGTEQLNRSLTDIDRHFYTRLSSTLSELDKCIAAMIDRSDNMGR